MSDATEKKPLKLTRKMALTMESLGFKDRTQAFVHILDNMRLSDKTREDGGNRERATVCRVLDLEDGKVKEMIVYTVVKSALHRHPGGYVGRSFEVYVAPKKAPGKEYKESTVWEVETPEWVADDYYVAPAYDPKAAPAAKEGDDG